jgi:hypothetical protein
LKVNIYTPAGKHVGYFQDPKIETFRDGDYEISGAFHAPSGELTTKVEFNPQALPYSADLGEAGKDHKKLKNVYVQRGRQPVLMSGQAS